MTRAKTLLAGIAGLCWAAWLILATYTSHDAEVLGLWSKRLFLLLVGFAVLALVISLAAAWAIRWKNRHDDNVLPPLAWLRTRRWRMAAALAGPVILWMVAVLGQVIIGPSADLADRLTLAMLALLGAIILWHLFVLLADRPQRESRRAAFRYLVALIGLLFGGLVVEVGGRLLDVEPLYAWNLNPPNLSVPWKSEEFDTQVTTNSQGLREPKTIEREHPGRFRIVVIGDSVTFGQGVNDEETYPRVLETNLHERGRKDCEVVNVSRRGAGPGEYLQYVRLAMANLDPDLVILGYYTLNDCPVRQPYAPRDPDQLAKLKNDILRESRPSWLMHSLCCRLIYRRAFLPLASSFNAKKAHSYRGEPDRIFGTANELGMTLAEPLSEAEQQRRDALQKNGWIDRGLKRAINPAPLVSAIKRPGSLLDSMHLRRETETAMLMEWMICEEILGEIQNVCRSHEVPLWCLIIPHPYQVDPIAVDQLKEWGIKTSPEMLTTAKQNDLATNFCRQVEIPSIDPLAEFRRRTEAGSRLFYPIDSHLTAEGHRLLAEMLAKKLLGSDVE